MKSSTFAFSCILLLLLFASQEMVEGKHKERVCQSLSHHFKGPCIHDHNCAYVCRDEAFSGGRCHGIRGRCFCTKFCSPEHP